LLVSKRQAISTAYEVTYRGKVFRLVVLKLHTSAIDMFVLNINLGHDWHTSMLKSAVIAMQAERPTLTTSTIKLRLLRGHKCMFHYTTQPLLEKTFLPTCIAS